MEIMRVPLSKPEITALDISNVVEVLRSRQLSLGPRVEEFERAFAAYAGTRHAVAVSSGTAALHLCIRALGIGANDEVITSSFSFVASANCALYEGALPVFADIDPVSLNLNPASVRRFIEEECTWDAATESLIDRRNGRIVKALLPVHVFGLPCDMDSLVELAEEYHLHIVEDACEALGAEYRGKRVGTIGRMATFAFYPNKQMTTGEGGMVVTDSDELARICRSMRNQGRDEGSVWLHHDRLGYNYRLSDLHCALGMSQLQRLDAMLAARENAAAAYSQQLVDESRVSLPRSLDGHRRSWFVYVLQIKCSDDHSPRQVRDAVILKLRERGIGSQAYFPAIHCQPYMQQYEFAVPFPLPFTEAASDNCLAVPMFAGASAEEIEYVCSGLRQALDSMGTAIWSQPTSVAV
jgi:perosamine synthetase